MKNAQNIQPFCTSPIVFLSIMVITALIGSNQGKTGDENFPEITDPMISEWSEQVF